MNSDKFHRTKYGGKVLISDMKDSHLVNTIKLLERMSIEGQTVRYGGGVCAEDIWYDEDTFFGKEALDILNYDSYKKELDKRNIEVEK